MLLLTSVNISELLVVLLGGSFFVWLQKSHSYPNNTVDLLAFLRFPPKSTLFFT